MDGAAILHVPNLNVFNFPALLQKIENKIQKKAKNAGFRDHRFSFFGDKTQVFSQGYSEIVIKGEFLTMSGDLGPRAKKNQQNADSKK